MRNDVSFPPDPNTPGDDDARPAANTPAARRAAAAAAAATRRNGRAAQPTHPHPSSPYQPPGPTHPHTPDRAHSLEKTRDRPATGLIYDTPEERGGIDSTVLSIVVVSFVAIGLLLIGWTIFRGADAVTKPTDSTVPNATIADDPKPPDDPK
jgi:hypothetical protein